MVYTTDSINKLENNMTQQIDQQPKNSSKKTRKPILSAKEVLAAKDRKELASMLKISEQYMYQCLTGRRDMNPAIANRIEKQTGGVLTRKMLCVNIWQDVWPDLSID